MKQKKNSEKEKEKSQEIETIVQTVTKINNINHTLGGGQNILILVN